MTIFMITHDLKESFELGTRVLVFDKVRHDPQAPERSVPRSPMISRATTRERGATAMRHRHHRSAAGRLTPGSLPGARRHHHPSYEKLGSQGWKAIEAEAKLSEDGWRKEQQWALDMGLPGSDSLTDRTIPTFSRGELPHYAGINTFLKAPYLENVRKVGEYDVAIVGIPLDSGTTYRPAPALAPRAFAASPPSTLPTTLSWA